MHPFGGTPVCPRCHKSVYAAEQTIGPGRKFYHKPCLTCTSCNKRLDSGSLVEHDQEPYCKQCHTKYFGTRDLRQANLPHRDEVSLPSSPGSLSPGKDIGVPNNANIFTRPTLSPINCHNTGAGAGAFRRKTPTPPLQSSSPSPTRVELLNNSSRPTSRPMSPTYLRPTRMLSSRTGDSTSISLSTASSPAVSMSPATPSDNGYEVKVMPRVAVGSPLQVENGNYISGDDGDDGDGYDDDTNARQNEYHYHNNRDRTVIQRSYKYDTPDRSKGAIPRTITLRPEHTYMARTYSSPSPDPDPKEDSNIRATNTHTQSTTPTHTYTQTPIIIPHSTGLVGRTGTPTSLLHTTPTGTRYGAALHSTNASPKPLSPTYTGMTATPLCARCTRPVYFAEQIKASGKTFHKLCLRCEECNTILDSARLTERKGGGVVCRSCYRKLYGPQGSGYALLGKAGG